MSFKSFILILVSILSIAKAQDTKEIKVGKLSEGIKVFVSDGKMGFLDSSGNKIDAPTFDFPNDDLFESGIPFFSEGLCLYFKKIVKDDQVSFSYGFIDKNFNEAIPAVFPFYGFYCDGFPTYFKSGRALVNIPKGQDPKPYIYMVIDKKGSPIGRDFEYYLGYTAACVFFPEISEGLVVYNTYDEIRKIARSGYFDVKTGKNVISHIFSQAGPLSDGIALVEIGGKYLTFIDKTGKIITDKKFYTVPIGSRRKSLYSTDYGTNFLGGFVDGKALIQFFDQNGTGKHIYALVDRKGTVLKKFLPEDEKQYSMYEWKF